MVWPRGRDDPQRAGRTSWWWAPASPDCSRRARLRRAAVRLTVIDRRNHHLFQPLLYQVATAGLGPNEIAYPIRSVFRRQRNTTVMMAEVKGVDLVKRLLELEDGTELTYDYLVIAVGAKPSYFGHDEWSSFAPGLKSLDDALDFRQRLFLSLERAERESHARRREELLTFVIVGGGPHGVELAGALAELLHSALRRDFRTIHPESAHVVLLEAGSALLPSFPSRFCSRTPLGGSSKLGVDVRLSTQVQAVDAAGVVAQGNRIDAGTVLWAAGVEELAARRPSRGPPRQRGPGDRDGHAKRTEPSRRSSWWETSRLSSRRGGRCRAWPRPPCKRDAMWHARFGGCSRTKS